VLTTMTLKRLASLGGSEEPMAAAARRRGANPRWRGVRRGEERVLEARGRGGGWTV
jgi:hypothetical protein